MEIYGDAEEISAELIERVYRAALAHFSLPDEFEIELTVCGEAEIRSVNASARGTDAVTDVLSFPALEDFFPYERDRFLADIDPDTGKVILGEILLCAPRARAQAAEYGHSYAREVGYLFLHALLHLMGFDHMTEEDKKIMRKEEDAILADIGLTREA